MTMSPVTALLMGFTFSFAWTPCVGPALTSVLLMAGSAQTSALGFLLIGVYTLGVYPSISGGGDIYGPASWILPPPYEGGALYGEDWRRSDDTYGCADVYRKDE